MTADELATIDTGPRRRYKRGTRFISRSQGGEWDISAPTLATLLLRLRDMSYEGIYEIHGDHAIRVSNHLVDELAGKTPGA
jgi:hypothetical protein